MRSKRVVVYPLVMDKQPQVCYAFAPGVQHTIYPWSSVLDQAYDLFSLLLVLEYSLPLHFSQPRSQKLAQKNPFEQNSPKLSTSYEPSRSTILSEKGCTGFTLFPNLEAAGKLGGQRV